MLTFALLMTGQALGAWWLLRQAKPAAETEQARAGAHDRFHAYWETKGWTPEMHGLYRELSK